MPLRKWRKPRKKAPTTALTRIRHIVIWLLSLSLILCLILCAYLWKLTQPFIAYPNYRPLHPANQTILTDPHRYHLNLSTLPCGNTQCLLMTPENRAPQAILVMLHGLGSRKEHLIKTASYYAQNQIAVILPDLPNHGENPNTRNGFGASQGEADIAHQTLAAARKQLHEPKIPAALFGISMGGSYANYNAAAHPNDFRALIIISSFDRLDHVLAQQIRKTPPSLQRPIIWIFDHLVALRGGENPAHVNPIDVAKNLSLPVFQVHGTADRLIPLKLGQNLHRAYQHGNFLTVPNGTHHNTLYAHPEVIYASIHFLQQTLSLDIHHYSQKT